MVTLGISEEHDAGAALVSHGTIVVASNEERYCREKFFYGFPKNVLRFVTKSISVNQKKSIRVAIASRFHVSRTFGNWENVTGFYRIIEFVLHITTLDKILWGSHAGPRLLTMISTFTNIVRKHRIRNELTNVRITNPSIQFVDHHSCHAASAFYSSGYDKALVITLDASGDGYCSKVFLANKSGLEELKAIPFYHSPGHYYEYVTLLLGFKLGREGKITGLSARGNYKSTYPIFKRYLDYDRINHQFINKGPYRSAAIRLLKKKLAGFSREDIAAGVQKHLETVVLAYISDMVSCYGFGKTNLAVAGGVFANVLLNQKVSLLPTIKSLFVFPHMGDGGLAAGAALYCDYQSTKTPDNPHTIPHLYLGDDIQPEHAFEAVQYFSNKVKVIKPSVTAHEVAKLLSHGKTVAIVRGPMEYGPRALGNRSILVQATDAGINTWLNKKLKRSEFMPFAPIVRKEMAADYFDFPLTTRLNLLFMTTTCNCRKRCIKEAPAIVHVDGTARPQIMTRSSNSFLYEILKQYQSITGLNILINTSFNMHESPIVRNANDAIKTFISGSLDYLVLDSQLICRKKRL